MTIKHHALVTAACCLTAVIFTTPLSANAAGKKKASPSPSPTASAAASPSASPGTRTVRVTPFHGMISAVDARAKTFSIAGKETSRTFKVSDQTTITKAGAPATMKDVVANEEVRGSYWKETDGTMMARTVKVGPLTDQEKAAIEARKAKRAEKRAAKDKEEGAASSATPEASPSASPKS